MDITISLETYNELLKLRNLCTDFVSEYSIRNKKDIYERDLMVNPSLFLVEDICDIVGYIDETD